ncbi:TadE/TadG family type IV pilus assembly protein [Pseudomonas saudiphocaensis]|uniref:TadE-like protein n=1 Tax=Pseudomonas saudiphocaensis TaxID=1499686 RepID=A0A078M093_9PSED|nr:TadE/TadG family type IV pilus assembly protein [Pseudomonas saudiphocaensis]CDZ95486.1 TadE-like protein [Pseudomonas saudiphocaensis]
MKPRGPQHGQAMVEFLIIIPVLILLIFGAVQAALIYSAKNGLNYATFQAARIASMNSAQYTDIRRGLLRGMYPMFSQFPENERMERTATEVDNFVLVTRISPSTAMFAAYGEDHGDLFGDGEERKAIPNSSLMYSQDDDAGLPLQDANLLKIRVQYCMRLIVPMVDRLLSSGSRFVDRARATKESASFRDVSRATSSNYEAVCRSRSGFVISSEATVRMQSPAVDDEDQCASGGRMICP